MRGDDARTPSNDGEMKNSLLDTDDQVLSIELKGRGQHTEYGVFMAEKCIQLPTAARFCCQTTTDIATL